MTDVSIPSPPIRRTIEGRRRAPRPTGRSSGRAGSSTGYSILGADGIDAAVALAKGCPVLAGGASIEVVETFDFMQDGEDRSMSDSARGTHLSGIDPGRVGLVEALDRAILGAGADFDVAIRGSP